MAEKKSGNRSSRNEQAFPTAGPRGCPGGVKGCQKKEGGQNPESRRHRRPGGVPADGCKGERKEGKEAEEEERRRGGPGGRGTHANAGFFGSSTHSQE